MATTIDPTAAALAGAVIGGVIGVLGTVITAWAASSRERKAFLRKASQQHAERVRGTYEFALNVLFNMNRDGSPDRATLGTVFAQISLFGSPEVNQMLASLLASSTNERMADLAALSEAMKRHLTEIEVAFM